MENDLYSFPLPDELIAREPVNPPDQCRLLAIGETGPNDLEHLRFEQLADLLHEGDLLVFNDTSVEARRVFLKRQPGPRGEGARLECVFLKKTIFKGQEGCWQVLIKKRSRLQNGEILLSEKMSPFYSSEKPLEFEVIKLSDGRTYLREPFPISPEIFSQIGQMPIPPYLKREEKESDRVHYQNPFGRNFGSAAAPTAALHFTPALRGALERKGVVFDFLTLHVGYGTFAPLKSENFKEKKLHHEQYFVPESLARRLRQKEFKRVVAVGTTTLRALETVCRLSGGTYQSAMQGETDIFLYPPDKIQSAHALITNFHLPGSSLIMLCATLCGRDLLLHAYQMAISLGYRFYSYGDAMFIPNLENASL